MASWRFCGRDGVDQDIGRFDGGGLPASASSTALFDVDHYDSDASMPNSTFHLLRARRRNRNARDNRAFPAPVLLPINLPEASRRVPVTKPEVPPFVVWLPADLPDASRKSVRLPLVPLVRVVALPAMRPRGLEVRAFSTNLRKSDGAGHATGTILLALAIPFFSLSTRSSHRYLTDMPHPEKNWKTVTRSQFPWEQEALDFIYEQFPAQDNYRAWANFEFIADDGSINEVDVLIAGPEGIFLVEIKSKPGDLSGDTRDWTWDHEGRRTTDENPILLTNRKAKRLKGLLARQKAFKKEGVPYIEPLVFVSHPGVVSQLSGNAEHYVCLRDTPSKPGIMAAIRRRECPGLKQFDQAVVNRPRIKALAQAMEQAGIRPSQKSRRVGDFLLEELVFDSPLGIYQDWKARHVSLETTRRVARIYLVSRQATPQDREIIHKAAVREFEILERLDHPGILKADPPTECEYGPVLFLREPPNSVLLHQFLSQEGASLPVHLRLDILRQIGEIIAYAHGRRIIHRSLSPQSILVWRDSANRPLVQVLNWQTGARLSTSDSGYLQRFGDDLIRTIRDPTWQRRPTRPPQQGVAGEQAPGVNIHKCHD